MRSAFRLANLKGDPQRIENPGSLGCPGARIDFAAGRRVSGRERRRVDWDGVGTFALFISSGAIGLGIIALRAYKAKLASKLEWARLERADDAPEQGLERIDDLEEQVQRLTERVDFTEKLLGSGRDGAEHEHQAPTVAKEL